MELESIDLGVCRGCLWGGDPEKVVIGLPGAFAVGAPALIFCVQALVRQGWSAIQVIDEYHDRREDATEWVVERATAALGANGDHARVWADDHITTNTGTDDTAQSLCQLTPEIGARGGGKSAVFERALLTCNAAGSTRLGRLLIVVSAALGYR